MQSSRLSMRRRGISSHPARSAPSRSRRAARRGPQVCEECPARKCGSGLRWSRRSERGAASRRRRSRRPQLEPGLPVALASISAVSDANRGPPCTGREADSAASHARAWAAARAACPARSERRGQRIASGSAEGRDRGSERSPSESRRKPGRDGIKPVARWPAPISPHFVSSNGSRPPRRGRPRREAGDVASTVDGSHAAAPGSEVWVPDFPGGPRRRLDATWDADVGEGAGRCSGP